MVIGQPKITTYATALLLIACSQSPPPSQQKTDAIVATTEDSKGNEPGKENSIPKRYPTSPADVVRSYVDLAAHGAHFNDKGRLELACLLTEGPPENEEVVFTTHIITGYRIVRSDVGKTEAHVLVEFDGVGFMLEDFYKFSPHRGKFTVNVQLKKAPMANWKIATPTGPCMSVETALDHLAQIKHEAHNPAYFENVIRDIHKAASEGGRAQTK